MLQRNYAEPHTYSMLTGHVLVSGTHANCHTQCLTHRLPEQQILSSTPSSWHNVHNFKLMTSLKNLYNGPFRHLHASIIQSYFCWQQTFASLYSLLLLKGRIVQEKRIVVTKQSGIKHCIWRHWCCWVSTVWCSNNILESKSSLYIRQHGVQELINGNCICLHASMPDVSGNKSTFRTTFDCWGRVFALAQPFIDGRA